MYPYLDFFNEQENQEMEYAADPEADDQDLRSHLNARMGSDRTHPVEPPPQDPVNVIHEVPVYPQATGPVTYQYPLHPMGVPDLNYPWWQGTPQYYPTPYQFPPGLYPQPAYVLVPETPLNPVNPELRRAQSERRAPGPYRDPSGPSRAPLPTQTEAEEAAEYESPRRRSAFDRLRRSARERLGALLQRGDVLTDHVLRRLGTAKEIVRHMRELRRQERAQTIALTRRVGITARTLSMKLAVCSPPSRSASRTEVDPRAAGRFCLFSGGISSTSWSVDFSFPRRVVGRATWRSAAGVVPVEPAGRVGAAPCVVAASTGRGALLPPKVTFGRGFLGPVEAGAKLLSRTIPAQDKVNASSS
nr:uncharacterized protein LOC109155647 [Ipomoea batatas]